MKPALETRAVESAQQQGRSPGEGEARFRQLFHEEDSTPGIGPGFVSRPAYWRKKQARRSSRSLSSSSKITSCSCIRLGSHNLGGRNQSRSAARPGATGGTGVIVSTDRPSSLGSASTAQDRLAAGLPTTAVIKINDVIVERVVSMMSTPSAPNLPRVVQRNGGQLRELMVGLPPCRRRARGPHCVSFLGLRPADFIDEQIQVDDFRLGGALGDPVDDPRARPWCSLAGEGSPPSSPEQG